MGLLGGRTGCTTRDKDRETVDTARGLKEDRRETLN